MVYLAAPYTIPDCLENCHKAIQYAHDIQATEQVTVYVPHLSLLWALVMGMHDEDYWKSYDLAFEARCDALLRLPGESIGADDEVTYAEKNNIPVFYSSDDLFAWINGADV